MIDNYHYNELYKRFEPQENKCTYCGREEVQNIDECYYIPLFMTKDSTNLVVYRSVKFAKILIGIPRCSNCKKIHENASYKAAMLSWGTAIALVVLLFYNMIALGGIVLALGFIAAIFIGIYGSQQLKDRFAVSNDIYALKDGAETNEIVRDLVLAGWSLEQPAP
jgi:hypothetical protein